MLNPRAILVVTGAGLLAACASGQSADISNISRVKSSFGPEYKVTEVPKAGIDPRLLQQQPLPKGITFKPPECAKSATAQLLPPGLKGNMAATMAEGQGVRYVAIALETSEPVPLADPGQGCQKVEFSGGALRGLVEAIESPKVDGIRSKGTHRVIQADVGGQQRTGDIYNYVAGFGDHLVLVTANPTVRPGKPAAQVDTRKARELLTAAVKAVKG
jgi:hypothetical protein